MELLMVDVNSLVDSELLRASNKFGVSHNSYHEAYAIILEEFEEAAAEADAFSEQLKHFWDSIKSNEEGCDVIEEMEMTAKKAAAEFIQVAAMCRKALRTPTT